MTITTTAPEAAVEAEQVPAAPRILIPLDEAIEGFSGVLPHVSKDDTATRIRTVLVQGAELLATDRFTVGRYTLADAEATAPLLVPRVAAEWVAKLNPRGLRRQSGYFVQLEQTGSTACVSILHMASDAVQVERSQLFDLTDTDPAGFPPVVRLFPAEGEVREPAASVALSPENLEKVTGWAKKFRKSEGISFTLPAASGRMGGPVHFRAGKLDGLLQPVLLRS